MSKVPTNADLKHRVVLCTSADVMIAGDTLLIQRKEVRECWAGIAPSREQLFSRDGIAIRESRDSASHKITIRYSPEQPISAAAWVFERRLKSEPRWFKVLGRQNLDEDSRFVVLRCRLVEERDDITAPATASAQTAPQNGSGAFTAKPQEVLL